MNVENIFSLEGKTVVVMGVLNDKSIGTAAAKTAVHMGARVIMTAQNRMLIDKRVGPIAESIGAEEPQVCDVSNEESMNSFFSQLADHYDTIDGLVHSIAYARKDEMSGPHMLASTWEGCQEAIRVSARSYFDCAKYVWPLMKNGGSLVAMSFEASERNWANYNDMAIAKTVLERYSMAIAAELGRLGIRSNIVSPGPMDTVAASAISGKHIVRHVARSLSPDNADTTLEEIGAATAFLLSDASRAINGAVIPVNHGLNLWAHPTPWGLEHMEEAIRLLRKEMEAGKYVPIGGIPKQEKDESDGNTE